MNPPAPDHHEELVGNPRLRRELTDSQRDRIVSRLLWELQSHGQNGRFARGTVTVVANEFYVCSKTIRRVWARALENFQNPEVWQFRSNTKKNVVDAIKSGTMRKYAKQFACFLFFRGKQSETLLLLLKYPNQLSIWWRWTVIIRHWKFFTWWRGK